MRTFLFSDKELTENELSKCVFTEVDVDGVAGQIEGLQRAIVCCQLSQALSAGELVPSQIQQGELEEAMETLCLADLVVTEVHLPQLHTAGQACVPRKRHQT